MAKSFPINPSPCNDEQVRQNWANTSNFVTQLFQSLGAPKPNATSLLNSPLGGTSNTLSPVNIGRVNNVAWNGQFFIANVQPLDLNFANEGRPVEVVIFLPGQQDQAKGDVGVTAMQVDGVNAPVPGQAAPFFIQKPGFKVGDIIAFAVAKNGWNVVLGPAASCCGDYTGTVASGSNGTYVVQIHPSIGSSVVVATVQASVTGKPDSHSYALAVGDTVKLKALPNGTFTITSPSTMPPRNVPLTYSQPTSGSVFTATVPLSTAAAPGNLTSLAINPFTAPTGGDKNYTIDFTKTPSGSSTPTSFLAGAGTVAAGAANDTIIQATINGDGSYSAGDTISAAVTAGGTTGTQGLGLLISATLAES